VVKYIAEQIEEPVQPDLQRIIALKQARRRAKGGQRLR
jgi:hypothetical protein